MELDKERLYEFHDQIATLNISRCDTMIRLFNELLEYINECEPNPNIKWLKDNTREAINELSKHCVKWKNKRRYTDEEINLVAEYRGSVLRNIVNFHP